MMKILGLNRPVPLVDGPTLMLVILASFIFAMAGLFDFQLKQVIPAPIRIIFYVAVAFSAFWQVLRQKFT